ncbi:MAG: fibronectin type III domain-containing protein [Dysgonamonadaceae bacterium]|jgi:hypothetical protein|nr:fibronectin type III domain-containing protein [Dysgonamonadaceae bacterium]
MFNCFLVALSIFLYSCEYELEDTNYVELKKPEDPAINVSLLAPTNEKGEYLVHYPYVKCKIEIPDEYKEHCQLYFSSDMDNIFSFNSNYDFIRFYFYEGDYYPTFPFSLKLKCEAVILPDSAKSIAEISGYEYLEKEFEWDIVVDPRPFPILNLKCEEISSNTWQLTWEKPDPYYGEVSFYEVYIWNSYTGSSYNTTNELFYDITLPDDAYYFSIEYRVTAYFKEIYLPPLSEYGYKSSY